MRLLATLVVLLGFVQSLVLILSRASVFYRVLSLIIWWPGFTALIASFEGVCLLLYIRGLRQLRPWEQPYGSQSNIYAEALDDTDDGLSVSEVKTHIFSNPRDARRDEFASGGSNRMNCSRRSVSISVDVCSSSCSSVTVPTSSNSGSVAMQTFGGPNRLECEARWNVYLRKPIVKKIWDDQVRVRSSAVRLLQDQMVLTAVCLAGAASSLLTVGSLWVPAGNMF